MTTPGQRAVPVNMPGSFLPARTLAVALAALLSTSVLAAPQDAPLVERKGRDYLFNEAAFRLLDAEVRRLQAVERLHLGEPSWATPFLVGMAVGVLTTGVVTLMWLLVPAVTPPSR